MMVTARKALFTFLIASCTPTYAATNTVLAACGASEGVAFYKADGRWSDDRLSAGAFTFVVNDKNEPNLLFKDSSGAITDARADGADVTFSFVDPAKREFGVVVNYSESELIETYSLIHGTDKALYLQWTVNRVGGVMPKVAAYTATCS
jgi:hypothetical protein